MLPNSMTLQEVAKAPHRGTHKRRLQGLPPPSYPHPACLGVASLSALPMLATPRVPPMGWGDCPREDGCYMLWLSHSGRSSRGVWVRLRHEAWALTACLSGSPLP
jgi:hypothetical protein